MSSNAEPSPSLFRRLLLVVGLIVLVGACGWTFDLLFRGMLKAPYDFAAFWAAGHLAQAGENPYQPDRVREIERALGIEETVIVVWNPPWTISFLIPFGALKPRIAFGAWVLLHTALLLLAAVLLWRGLGGQPKLGWLACLLTLGFIPTTLLLGGGQITAIVMFGLAGFLIAVREDRPFLAGLMGGLTAVKPHLLTLFAVWIFLEATRSHFGRRILFGGLVSISLACLFPTLNRPEIWSDYWNAVKSPPSIGYRHLSEWTPPLLGWWLRMAVPGTPFWVQWVPLLLGTIGFIGWWLLVGRRSRCDWVAQLPWIVGGSMLIAPYGVWHYDLVLLLIPILAVVAKVMAKPTRAAIAIGGALLLILNLVCLIMMLNRTSTEWYVWVTPSVLLWSIMVNRMTAGNRDVRTIDPIPSPAGA